MLSDPIIEWFDEKNIASNLQVEIEKWNRHFFPENLENDKYFFGKKQFNPKRLVVSIDGKLVAHLLVVERAIKLGMNILLTLYVGEVFVIPNFQGRGFGLKLFDVFEKQLGKKKYDCSLLLCTQRNIEFYKKCGWVNLKNITTLLGTKRRGALIADDILMARLYSLRSKKLLEKSSAIFLGDSV